MNFLSLFVQYSVKKGGRDQSEFRDTFQGRECKSVSREILVKSGHSSRSLYLKIRFPARNGCPKDIKRKQMSLCEAHHIAYRA